MYKVGKFGANLSAQILQLQKRVQIMTIIHLQPKCYLPGISPHGVNSPSSLECTPVHNVSYNYSSYSKGHSDEFRKGYYSKNAMIGGACAVSMVILAWCIKKKADSLDKSAKIYKINEVAIYNPKEVLPSGEGKKLNFSLTSASSPTEITPGEEIPGLPTYTATDVNGHDNLESRIWVCYKSGIYDITDFISQHPGGDRILMAAGGALEPFWELFTVHKSSEVLKILEEYRIGNLRSEDRSLASENIDDPFASEPLRHPILIPSSLKPFNAEPPLELLVESFTTPNEIFFVRNHLPVPEIDPNTYELEIYGMGMKPMKLKLDDLKTKFKKYTIISTIQCAGNRRSELNKVKEVSGLKWGPAAISTAEWSGVRLVDVLKYAEVDLSDPQIQHVQFEGLDTDAANVPYGASVPAEKALDPLNDIILAYEMNGQVLPVDHGYPLRVIVPGVVGARDVKWLGSIILSEKESPSHWQQNDYKGFSPSITWENVDFREAPAIQELPVTSAICKPSDGSTVLAENANIEVCGYAWSGGGRKIIRVDVSSDCGETWHAAHLLQDLSPLYRSWAWTIWKASLPIPKEAPNVEIICKAVDSSYNVQPETFPPIWNLRGVLGNAWHRVNVTVKF